MTNAEWWARVVQARTRHDDLLPQRVWMLSKGAREASIDLRAVPGVGAEIVLSVDGELRRTRLYRAHDPVLADTYQAHALSIYQIGKNNPMGSNPGLMSTNWNVSSRPSEPSQAGAVHDDGRATSPCAPRRA